MKQKIEALNEKFAGSGAKELISCFLKEYGVRIALSSSLGLEDQVLTDMVCSIDKNARIFTLDTGRLFPETYDLIHRTNTKYDIQMHIFFPEAQQVESMVNSNGINLFYNSVEARKTCCRVRKIEPLQRAFTGLSAWICGLRRDQSVTRSAMRPIEWDEVNGLIKINPLIDWSEDQVKEYIRENKVPYNPLHDKNYPSIGCQPCTRAVLPGEDLRAGRWWWENPDTKECGLHKR